MENSLPEGTPSLNDAAKNSGKLPDDHNKQLTSRLSFLMYLFEYFSIDRRSNIVN